MAAAFRLLLLSIWLSAASVLFDQPIVPGFAAAALAAGVATAALAIPPGEAEYLQRLFRPAALVLAMPAAWMVIQILPLKFVGLAHPIWASAAEALGQTIHGGISIDIGATLLALGQYLLFAAGAFLAGAVAIDRQRARGMLATLAVVASLIAILALIHDVTGASFLRHLDRLPTGDAAIAGAALGAILAAASTIQQFDLDAGGPGKRDAIGASPVLARIVSLAALAACAIALVLSAKNGAMFATACGLATLGALVAIRRFSIGPWGYAAIAVVAVVVAVAVIAIRFDLGKTDPTLAFATGAPRSLVGVTQRIAAEAGWTGTGAGTFAALVPIYRDVDEAIAEAWAPTAAAAIAIEIGRPMLIIVVIAALAGIAVLFRGTLRRGRDACYPAVGAGCLLTLVVLAFCQTGLFNTAVASIAAATIGLALAQSRSRTVR